MRLPRLVVPLAAAGAAAWYVRSVYRFRDPVRLPTAQANAVLSPVDGTVSFIRRAENGQIGVGEANTLLKMSDLLGVSDAPPDGWLIGVFVGPLDVHYVYQPITGSVTQVVQSTGQTSATFGPQTALSMLAGQATDLLPHPATKENERYSYTVQGDQAAVTVSLVAPGQELNATTYIKEGTTVRLGNKAAFLPEGGLALVSLPAGAVPTVSVGDRITGATTVLSRLASIGG